MVPSNVVEVNERGTELLTLGNRDYLLNAKGGVVTPHSKLQQGSGTIHHTVQVHVDARADQAQTLAAVKQVVASENAKFADAMQQQRLIGN